jgi:hypothetical protein
VSPLRVYTKDGLPKGSDQLVVPAAMDGWHVVGDAATGLGTALANSWAQVAGFATVGFRKFPTGVVRLRGAITGGTGGLRLVSSFRPLVLRQDHLRQLA